MGQCLLGLAFLPPQWGSLSEVPAENHGYVHHSLLPTTQLLGFTRHSVGAVPLLPPLVQRSRVKMDWEKMGNMLKGLERQGLGMDWD